MVVANMARFLSVSVTELVVKVTIVLVIKLGLMSAHDWLNVLASLYSCTPKHYWLLLSALLTFYDCFVGIIFLHVQVHMSNNGVLHCFCLWQWSKFF